MAFVEGVANSYADLRTAIETAMLANGWTKSGTVLHADGCFVEFAVSGTTLTLKGGAGLAGGNTLQDPGPNVVRIGKDGTVMQMTFPVIYQIALHVSPREAVVYINYNVDSWQWLAFGKSTIDLPGSGVWYAGSMYALASNELEISPTGGTGDFRRLCPGPFWGGGVSSDASSYIHSGLDGAGWSWPGYYSSLFDGDAHISKFLTGLIDRQPSSINGAAILLPAQVWRARSGNTASLVVDMKHVRILRIDSYAPGDVIEYGLERWRVYPFMRKNVASRNGGLFRYSDAPNAHTGTMGMAVRYDGP